MSSLGIIFAGSGEFGLPTLRALRAAGHEIVKVVSQPDRPAGRGRRFKPTAISAYAMAEALPLLRTGDINLESLPSADVMVVIAFGQKIAEHQVHHARLGSVNLHGSRLPKYRGAAPVNWAILRGERVTGNSVIRLASKMDAGAILAQSEISIGEVETAGELHDRLAEDGAPLVLDVLGKLAGGRATESPQDDSLTTLAPRLSREAAHLDWSHPAADLANRIRGLFPWPGCHARLTDALGNELSRFVLARARPVAIDDPRWSPGEITPEGLVTCGSSATGGSARAVDILELQPEGKRLMTLRDFRNGHPWCAGMRLESLI